MGSSDENKSLSGGRAAGTKPPAIFAERVGENLLGSKGDRHDSWSKTTAVDQSCGFQMAWRCLLPAPAGTSPVSTMANTGLLGESLRTVPCIAGGCRDLPPHPKSRAARVYQKWV